MRYVLVLMVVMLWGSWVWSQKAVSIGVFDRDTHMPISGVNVFIAGTTIGCATDDFGRCNLRISSHTNGEIIFSHVNYDSFIISGDLIQKSSLLDSIFLNRSMVQIPEISIVASNDKEWKKNFKRFRDKFIGKNIKTKGCKIMNPEVLVFEDEGATFKVKSNDILHIRNPYLGYNIQFLLLDFEISKDGSSTYLGHAYFSDYKNIDNQISEHRKKTFLRSSRNFFDCLIRDDIEGNYIMRHGVLKNGVVIPDRGLSRSEVLRKAKGSIYEIMIDDYLVVEDLHNKSLREVPIDFGVGDAHAYNGSSKETTIKLIPETSYLRSKSGHLYVDKTGKVLNKKYMEEYGYWGEMRVCMTLPDDYVVRDRNERPEYLDHFLALTDVDFRKAKKSWKWIKKHWKEGYLPMLVDVLRICKSGLKAEIVLYVKKKIGDIRVSDYYTMVQWLWEKAIIPVPGYMDLKAQLYKKIDSRFFDYFYGREEEVSIDPIEVLWGGVKQDGIPPLRFSDTINGRDATYLNDNDVVFGIVIDGISKAYPKRILAWHEMAIDSFGKVVIAVVYCTLCGTVIPYDTRIGGEHFDFGTSGFLYRSNKLMYDKKSQSLWSTISGRPVIGPLVGKGLILKSYPVVVTTWADWKKKHPRTKVLSINTGYQRDYSEGAAYKDYFESEELMFPVPVQDRRLDAKAEVLVVDEGNTHDDPIAIAIDFLKRNPLLYREINGTTYLFLTSKQGAVRVYKTGNEKLEGYEEESYLVDENGNKWMVSDEKIESRTGIEYPRVSAHRMFWFAWVNAHPNTKLLK